eukprot:jgi/Mesvir1/15948/Mv08266-RA.1
MNPDLVKERAAASFPCQVMTELIDGGAQWTARKRELRQLLQDELASGATALNKRSVVFMDRSSRFERGLEVGRILQGLKKKHALSDLEYEFLSTEVGESTPYSIHDYVFVPCLQSQCSPEQRAYWEPLAKDYAILGAYAQTELGHGSNIKALETTATFIGGPEPLFELHTPTRTATKWWPGALGKTATHAVVFARLLLGGTDHGMHPFMVQLRSLEDHSVLPGIEVGDIGPKFGMNAVDNGFLRLHRVRVPRTHMLMRFAKVTEDGKYIRAPHDKAAYGTMIAVRVHFVRGAALHLSRAATIAVRYSAVRRQGGGGAAEGGEPEGLPRENQVLDYRTQQHRLLPLVAAAYAFHFTARKTAAMMDAMIQAMASGDVSGLGQMHALSSGLKSFTTEIAAAGIDECRKCCGGHGYSALSGLPDLVGYFTHMETAEGENLLLTQQAMRFLLKSYDGKQGPLAVDLNEKCNVARAPEWRDRQQQLHALRHRATRLVTRVGRALAGAVAKGAAVEAAWNDQLVDIAAASRAYCSLHTCTCFMEAVAAQQIEADRGVEAAAALTAVLKKLCDLFVLHQLLGQVGDLLEDGYMRGEQVAWLRGEVMLATAISTPLVLGGGTMLCSNWLL